MCFQIETRLRFVGKRGINLERSAIVRYYRIRWWLTPLLVVCCVNTSHKRTTSVSRLTCPDEVRIVTAGPVIPPCLLGGFKITNLSTRTRTISYQLSTSGSGTLSDLGNSKSLAAGDVALRPGRTYCPPNAALIFPHLTANDTQQVYCVLTWAGSPAWRDTCVTTVFIEVDVPVAPQSPEALPGSAGMHPTPVHLEQNWPNPLNPSTTIYFTLPRESEVRLVIYDSCGKLVRTLFSGVGSQGTNTIAWDGTNNDGVKVPSGVYFYRLKVGEKVLTRKMVLLK